MGAELLRTAARDRQLAGAKGLLGTMDGELHLVLAENEATASEHTWRDVTGERYHFPNVYRNMVVPGVRFVYYRGSRRASGRRATPEYFGCGVVGDVYVDADTTNASITGRKWIAEIADYQPFGSPVPFRTNGMYSELLSDVAPRNRWGTGVRDRIAEECRVDEIWKPATSGGAKSSGQSRYIFDQSDLSERARVISQEARRIFLEHLRSNEPNRVKWGQIRVVPSKVERLSYDLEDCREGYARVYVVKGTTGPQFASIEMTGTQMQCAVSLRERFGLALVSDVFGAAPRLAVVPNVAEAFETKRLTANVTRFRVEVGA
jgi:hypothetical protein